MAKYKAYPEYKDSGVEWIGKIPSHWEVASLSKLFSIKAGGDVQQSLFSEVCSDEYPYPIYTNANDEFAVYGYTKKANYQSNTITVSGRGDVGFAVYRNHAYDAIIRLLVLAPLKQLECKFYSYFINSVIDFKVESSAIGQLSTQQISPYKSVTPSRVEQRNITTFLDYETAKIDNLIEKQQQLIELLKEKRQAVISHAVTKGLNPNVPMKDSGVEWLGYIPKSCIVTKLKYVTVLKTEKGSSNNTRYVGMENISSNTGEFLHKDEASSEGSSVSFERGDILFGKLRPYLAKSWLATFSGVCSSEFLVFQSKKIHAKYLNYYLLTNEFIKQVDSSTYGSKMPRANWEFINQLPVPTWSYEESKAISVYLDNLTAKLDWLLEKQQQQITLLQERRTALISAAVTGKIDVRDWRAPDAQKTEEPQEATI
ncbi:restriction endonuclease subunit S [Cronobacter dublinensis]|uniref:restriction endonuclease subunit S n=1 Tax=Cronobacter dublinensis TaxID=413497 RepID=UPI00300DEBCC